MSDGSESLIQDLEDSENHSFEELQWEGHQQFRNIYFYKCRSYIKEQKARIVIERNSVSILCINTDLSQDPKDLQSYFENPNPIKNGFITVGSILSNNVQLQKLNFNDSQSLDFRELQSPVVAINIPIDFLIEEIYVVSLKDLTGVTKLDYNDLFLVDTSVVDNPWMINEKDLNQVPVNLLNLIPVSSYNASRTNAVSINLVKPISLNDIKTDNNKYIFSINTGVILWSNMQFFANVLSNGIVTDECLEIDVYNSVTETNIVSKFPVKLSINNSNNTMQFENEWTKFCLEWNIAKDFQETSKLEDLLTLKNIPKQDIIFNDVKIKRFNKRDLWIGDKNGNQIGYDYTKFIDDNFHSPSPVNQLVFSNEDNVGSDRANVNRVYGNVFVANRNDLVKWERQDLGFTPADKSIILIDKNGITINTNGVITYADEEGIIIDIQFNNTNNTNPSYVKTINNIRLNDLKFNSILTSVALGRLNNVFLTGKYVSGSNFNFTIPDISLIYDSIYTYWRLNDKIYKKIVVNQPIPVDNQILVNLLKEILSFTINYRLGFPDTKYDDLTGNPINDMARLKNKFQIQGTSPLEAISNTINNFLMINPLIKNLDEWNYFIQALAMLSQNIYSIYSINTGTKAEEELTLPYYFDIASPAVKTGNDDNYTYQYPNLLVKLNSKYFNFEEYNDEPFNQKMFNKLPTLNTKLTAKNNYLKVVYPFINSALLETNPTSNAQNYDINQEDFQRYVLYWILSSNNIGSLGTNQAVFDRYMNTIFTVKDNYPAMRSNFNNMVCPVVELDQFYSSDNTIIGDLPFEATFNDSGDSDELYSEDNSIIVTELPATGEPIESSDKTIIITKEI